MLSTSGKRLSAKCMGYLALPGGSPWPSAAHVHGKGSCLRMAGSSLGQLHCSQAKAPQHRLYHSWRWENFPESDAETQETVNERGVRVVLSHWYFSGRNNLVKKK